MTTTPERRTATLSEQVAEEIRAWLGRRRMSQAQLSRVMGQSQMWVSDRLRGVQPIGLDDLQRFATALGVEVHDLLPSREEAAQASVPPLSRRREGINRHFRSPDDGLVDRNRTDDLRRARVIFDGPTGQGRVDSRRPVSAVPASKRRPRDGRPRNRTVRAA